MAEDQLFEQLNVAKVSPFIFEYHERAGCLLIPLFLPIGSFLRSSSTNLTQQRGVNPSGGRGLTSRGEFFCGLAFSLGLQEAVPRRRVSTAVSPLAVLSIGRSSLLVLSRHHPDTPGASSQVVNSWCQNRKAWWGSFLPLLWHRRASERVSSIPGTIPWS